MRARFITLLLSLTFIVGCGQNVANLPAPSSEEVQTTSAYPAVVEIILPGGSAMCSGTFVSPTAILTAAHCALNDGTYTIIASFGQFETTNHVNYGPGQVDDPNDIAILWFNSPVADPTQGQVINLGTSVAIGDVATLVGFGCTNIDTETGAGTKRAGTNVVYQIDDYVEFVTPIDDTTGGGGDSNALLGASNRTGSCFGDSGGPAMVQDSSGNQVEIALTHAGGSDGTNIDSEYVNLTRSDNQSWLQSENSSLGLNISGL